jgi:2-polyprenyl-6-methoxyphenol hydroxylase-like FAD-dependent oxidoreductase
MDVRVAIVGAGPAGALLGYLLASRGIDTLLIERQSDFEREFRGEFLMPSGIRALNSAGFDLETIAHRTPEQITVFMKGRSFLTVRIADFAEINPHQPMPTAVSQPELLEGLVALGESTGHLDFRRGTTVRRIELQNDGSRRLHVRTEAGDEILDVPYLIGSDGRGSVCRRSLAPKVLTRGAPLDVVWFKMPYPKAWEKPAARIEIGRGHLMIVLPSADGLLQMAWVIVKGTYGDLKSRNVEEWADEMTPHTDPELAAHIQEHRDALSRPFLLRAAADYVRGWASSGALLIGDAAHTMSPVGAQGINIALRDAIVAANELVPALQKGSDLDLAAAKIEGLRSPEINRIQRIASLPPRFALGRTVFHDGVRRMIPYLAQAGIRSGRGAGGAMSFMNGVTDVELEI